MRTKLRVKWFNDSKGFGYLKNMENGDDIFAHYSRISGDVFKTLIEGQLVTCTVTEDGRGKLIALDIEKDLTVPIIDMGVKENEG